MRRWAPIQLGLAFMAICALVFRQRIERSLKTATAPTMGLATPPAAGRPRCLTTITTAFFELRSSRSKHSHAEYRAWTGNFFHRFARHCIVVYSDVPFVMAHCARHGPRCAARRTALRNTSTWRAHPRSFWRAQHKLDPARYGVAGHGPDLYRVWAAKPEFVAQTLDWNPFGSAYHFWLDIGQVRWARRDRPARPPPPPSARVLAEIGPDSVLVINFSPFRAPAEFELGRDCATRYRYDRPGRQMRLAGTGWGGPARGVARWLAAYAHTWKTLARTGPGRFVGDDQRVMPVACTAFNHLCQMFEGTYFDMPAWLAGVEAGFGRYGNATRATYFLEGVGMATDEDVEAKQVCRCWTEQQRGNAKLARDVLSSATLAPALKGAPGTTTDWNAAMDDACRRFEEIDRDR